MGVKLHRGFESRPLRSVKRLQKPSVRGHDRFPMWRQPRRRWQQYGSVDGLVSATRRARGLSGLRLAGPLRRLGRRSKSSSGAARGRAVVGQPHDLPARRGQLAASFTASGEWPSLATTRHDHVGESQQSQHHGDDSPSDFLPRAAERVALPVEVDLVDRVVGGVACDERKPWPKRATASKKPSAVGETSVCLLPSSNAKLTSSARSG